jgi:hypothetical protein
MMADIMTTNPHQHRAHSTPVRRHEVTGYMSQSHTERYSVVEKYTFPDNITDRTINMVASDFFNRFTHRTTHVASHMRWLEAKGARALPDWDDAGELDCMYGAVLKAAQFNNVKLIKAGVNDNLRFFSVLSGNDVQTIKFMSLICHVALRCGMYRVQ